MKVIVAEPVKIYQIVLRMRLKNSPILIVSTPEEAKTAMAEAPKGSVLVGILLKQPRNSIYAVFVAPIAGCLETKKNLLTKLLQN
jgi:hypothetical protein